MVHIIAWIKTSDKQLKQAIKQAIYNYKSILNRGIAIFLIIIGAVALNN